jgi:aspartate/methionine/tyrosine aminotransferase
MKIAPFKLERFFAKYEFKAPYLLSSSDCESLTVDDLLAYEPAARDRLNALWLGYTESEGRPELRSAITQLYEKITADQVLVCAGAEEAIFLFMNATLNNSDHVIVHTPCYQSLTEIATSIGCEITAWQTNGANNWELDTDQLSKLIRPNTRAVIVNSPHNPTGYLMSHETQQHIIEIARQHGIVIFSDEVYRYLEHDATDTLPAMCDLYENAVSLGVMSKTYGLAGLRIGWIATQNSAIRAAIASYKDYTSICNSAPSELLAIVALNHRDEIAARNLNIIRQNLSLLDLFFSRYEDLFQWWHPKAGSIAYPHLKLAQDVESFCIDVVEKSGVLLLPGTCYEVQSRHFRIGFGRMNMSQALEQFEQYLGKYGWTK